MNFRDFIDWVRVIEGEFPVTSWRVRGIHAWPIIRLTISSATFRAGVPAHALDAGWRRLGVNVARGLAAWARASIGDRRANRHPWDRADAVFLATSVGRRPVIEGKRYDARSGPYVELLEQFGARTLVWEKSPYGEYNVPRHTPSALVQPHLIRIRAMSQLLPLGDDRVELEDFARFQDRVLEAGLRFPHANLERLRRDMFFVRLLADRFAGWLRRARPRLGFVANAALPEQAFCLACRELDIVSVEVQHGVQGDLHPGYGSWFAVPPGGWETRARIFWSWDEDSAAAIQRWATKAPDSHAVLVGGDPWREKTMDEGSDTARSTIRLIEERQRASGADRHILVTLTSQGPVVPPPLLDAVRSSPSTWRYWFRLHPVGQTERMKEAKRILAPMGVAPDSIEFATEVPLHLLLRRMNGHLSVGQSTVVAEAALHGVPSVATSLEAPAAYPAEAAAGLLVTAETATEMLEALHRLLDAGVRQVTPEVPRAAAAMRRLLAGDVLFPRAGPAGRSNG